MISFWRKWKRLMAPVWQARWPWSLWFLSEIFDVFQSVFVIQIGAWIVGVILLKDTEGVMVFTGLYLGVTFLSNFLSPFTGIADVETNLRLEYALFYSYFGRYILLDNNKTETVGTGKMNTILIQGIDSWQRIVKDSFVGFIIEAFAILYSFILIFISVPFFYFFGLLAIFSISMLILHFSYKITVKSRQNIAEMEQDFGRKKVQIIMSKFEIYQSQKFEHESSRVKALFKKASGYFRREQLVTEGLNGFSSFLVNVSLALVYCVIGFGVIRGEFTLAHFTLLIGLVNIVAQYMWSFRRLVKSYHHDIIYVEELWKTFDSIPLINDPKDAKHFEYKNGDITMNNIYFSYDITPVFSDFSLKIFGGKKTALVGLSGSGKTTLIKLISAYIQPNQGQVIVDGQDLATLKLSDYYRHIGYLTQEPMVFDGTIRENLTYALFETPNETILSQAIQNAQCDFVYGLKNGLDTEIGEKGIRLSGGQRQRLAIAKIFLKNPQIIILDEPTSSLDSFSEEEVMRAFDNLFKNRTVIIIAHRLQTVKNADEIIVLDKGVIIERGAHQVLYDQNGYYRKMLELQSGF